MLIVGRDRAHVRTLLERFPNDEVISASLFFDRIRMLPFLYNEKLTMDNGAPEVLLYDILAQNNEYSTHLAKNFSALYSSLYHGLVPPKKALGLINHSKLLPVLSVVKELDQAMDFSHLLTNTSALYYAKDLIEKNHIIPPSLFKTPHICLYYLVDLTALEIETIKTLSRLGIFFKIFFPLDFAKRGINIAIDYMARQFEASPDTAIEICFDSIAMPGPLKILSDNLFREDAKITLLQEHCSIELCHTLYDEADFLAKYISFLKVNDAKSSIVIALRSFDDRAVFYKRALALYGIELRDRKGEPLAHSPAALLLKTFFSARLFGLQRKDLIGLINHALLKKDDCSDLKINEVLTLLGIDDAIFLAMESQCRFEKSLENIKKIVKKDENLDEQITLFESVLNNIKNLLSFIPLRDSWASFITNIKSLLNVAFHEEDRSVKALLDCIESLSLSSTHASQQIYDLSELENRLWDTLLKTTLAPLDYGHQDAVEILLLPELAGRSFDHVFIPDISFGRLPKSPHHDPLLSDKERLMLNKELGFSALRIFMDDPFEPLPVPSRQALEPFWFAAAIACAKKSVHFSCASHDEDAKEISPSLFFMWLKDNVTLQGNKKDFPFISKERERFLKGQAELHHQQGEAFSIIKSRKLAFLEQKTDYFAFFFEPALIEKCFDGRLHEIKPHRPLTPTMVEAFSSCAFYGLLSRIVGLGTEHSLDDIDARVLGNIAHQTLELYFDKGVSNKLDCAVRLKDKIAWVKKEYLSKNFVRNIDVFDCYVDWVFDALLQLIKRLHNEGYDNPIVKEAPFGVGSKSFSPIMVKSKGGPYLLGGIIDRVDKKNDKLVIIDYKLARTSSLKELSSPRALMHSNFQIPIYLRLIERSFSKYKEAIHFIYASIRDGVLLEAWPKEHSSELIKAIFDDNEEHSLANTIDEIFAPIKKGQVLAKVSEQCSYCDYAFICRKSENRSES